MLFVKNAIELTAVKFELLVFQTFNRRVLLFLLNKNWKHTLLLPFKKFYFIVCNVKFHPPPSTQWCLIFFMYSLLLCVFKQFSNGKVLRRRSLENWGAGNNSFIWRNYYYKKGWDGWRTKPWAIKIGGFKLRVLRKKEREREMVFNFNYCNHYLIIE